MSRRRPRKPTLYVDSNVLSVLCYRGVRVSTLHQYIVSRGWWETERKFFQLFGSRFTEKELRRGHYAGQKEAVALVRRLGYLPLTAAVRQCAEDLLGDKVVPPNKPGDATQLAFAIVYRIDYLLTWNYAHLANVHVQARLVSMCEKQGWRAPLLVSPENIPRVGLGQSIWRSKDA